MSTSRSLRFLVFVSLFACSHTLAMINLCSGEDMVLDGETVAEQAICLECEKTFGGVGHIEAPEVEIFAETFEFSGSIACDKTCVIHVQNPFDETMFTRMGSGEFSIIISPVSDCQKCEEQKDFVASDEDGAPVVFEVQYEPEVVVEQEEVFEPEEVEAVEVVVQEEVAQEEPEVVVEQEEIVVIAPEEVKMVEEKEKEEQQKLIKPKKCIKIESEIETKSFRIRKESFLETYGVPLGVISVIGAILLYHTIGR